MSIRRALSVLLFLALVVAGGIYVRGSLRRASAPPLPAREPSLDDAPVRLYGLVEPLGREAFVGPLQPRRVLEVLASEGAVVKAGAVLCRLDDEVERQALRVAELRVEEARRRRELTEDDLARKRRLSTEMVVPEFELSRAALQARLEDQQIATALAEVELRRVELEKLTLRSPLTGIVYRMDVRAGEQLTPQDYGRIVVGLPGRQVRVFVEAFWLGRLKPGERLRVREAESGREVGTGTIRTVSPYVGTRDFRTEDRLERIDTKFAQAVLELEAPTEAPIGMQVVCESQARSTR
jgi:multidrug efflux pump subunit AcrA (membrane-fusion protein)